MQILGYALSIAVVFSFYLESAHACGDSTNTAVAKPEPVGSDEERWEGLMVEIRSHETAGSISMPGSCPRMGELITFYGDDRKIKTGMVTYALDAANVFIRTIPHVLPDYPSLEQFEQTRVPYQSNFAGIGRLKKALQEGDTSPSFLMMQVGGGVYRGISRFAFDNNFTLVEWIEKDGKPLAKHQFITMENSLLKPASVSAPTGVVSSGVIRPTAPDPA